MAIRKLKINYKTQK